MSRDQWVAYLKGADLGSRYFWPSAYSYLESSHDPNSTKRFVELLSQNEIAARQMGLVYFLLKPSLGNFAAELPRILKTLRHSNERAFDDRSYSLRGRVDWQRTIKGRLNGSVPAGAVSTARHNKLYDTLENRLLKLFLKEVSSVIAELSKLTSGARLPNDIERIRAEVEDALASAYLNEVADVRHASAGMVINARRSRTAHYQELARLWIGFEDALLIGKVSGLLDLISEGWLAPVSDDDLFELYVLALTIDVGTNELGFGFPKNVDVIRSGRGAVATFTSEEREIEIFFNQSPTTIFHDRSSKYRNLVSAHRGISGSERRPDIVLKFEGSSSGLLFIECKNSSDENYIRDSIYKCFGYLYDFSDFLVGAHSPKGIAYFSGAVRPEKYSGDLVAISDRDTLSEILRSSLDLKS
jgi:hypothetical protein